MMYLFTLKSFIQLTLTLNIIPVIAKADSMTIAELAEFKARVTKELADGGVEVYSFPQMLSQMLT
jgi:septin family protein